MRDNVLFAGKTGIEVRQVEIGSHVVEAGAIAGPVAPRPHQGGESWKHRDPGIGVRVQGGGPVGKQHREVLLATKPKRRRVRCPDTRRVPGVGCRGRQVAGAAVVHGTPCEVLTGLIQRLGEGSPAASTYPVNTVNEAGACRGDICKRMNERTALVEVGHHDTHVDVVDPGQQRRGDILQHLQTRRRDR